MPVLSDYFSDSRDFMNQTVGLRRLKLRKIIASDGAISLALIKRLEAASNSSIAIRETAFPFNGAASSGDSEIVASQIRLATPCRPHVARHVAKL